MPKRAEAKPWERQEGESVKAFEAFSAYLEMGGDRSLRAVGQKLGKSTALMERWSRTYKWVERVKAHDAALQQQAYDRAVKKTQQMTDRHISMALKLQAKALEALEATDPKDIDPKNLLAFIREATKLEREARAAAVHAADPRKDEEKNGTGLADVIAEAWERRQNGETDD